ncbi:MAG: D-alanyl-D-alanine carboxypeptidase/D-alanyl-D-alanine-endopeptidase [Sphingobacteriaceae bacterium]|nr:D-alanyl-D-alanine carboxypeptidase/D-alanyl-D-alanine-endopeptidase [Sphingobacteriaceae bacterium]
MFKKISFLLVFGLQNFAIAQTTAQSLAKNFAILEQDKQNKYATTSICILDAQTGKVIFAKNENIGIAPASTLKVITAASALAILGEKFTYQTTLAHSGNIENGVLKGDIYIVGSGDPTLGSHRYEGNNEKSILSKWVKAIQNKGITKIEGSIIAEDSIWDTQSIPDGWIWQDIGNYYGTGVYSLNWKENQLNIYLKPTKINEPVEFSTDKIFAKNNLLIQNEVLTGAIGTKDQTFAYVAPYSSIVYLRGTWATDISKNKISIANPDPALTCAMELEDELKNMGIEINKKSSTSRLLKINKQQKASQLHKIISTESPNLSEIIYWFLKKSVNLYGEALLKTIAQKTNKNPSTTNGIEAIFENLEKYNIDRHSINIFDGSGLSPANRVSAASIAKVLYLAQNQPWFKSYYTSFPEHNGMKIKSGNIESVAAYAGYHTNSKGEKYIIVINSNNFSGRGMNKKLYPVLDALK